jgi:integrase
MAGQLIQRGRVWYLRFTDAHGRRTMKRLATDKRVAEQLARRIEDEQDRIRGGWIDEKDLAYRASEARPLCEHVRDWHKDLLARGATPAHAELSRARVTRVLELAGLNRISAVSPSRIQAALKAVRDAGAALQTVRHYTTQIKAFSRWLWKDGRAREHTLAHLSSPNPQTDRRRIRRALDAEELRRLIEAAERGPTVGKLTGPDRAMLYRLAMETGFRRNELRTLAPESFALDGNPPTVTVKAAYSKHRRDDVQPIRPEAADILRPWLAARTPGKPLFGRLTQYTARMLRHDLEAAGIPFQTDSGTADFHALRHSFISALARSNAPVKIVQSLARHSTPTLTLGVYAHVRLYDQSAALEALPDLTRSAPDTQSSAGAATGTDASHANTFAPILIHSEDVSVRDCAPVDVIRMSDGPIRIPCGDGSQAPESQGFDASTRVVSHSGVTEEVGFEPTVPRCGTPVFETGPFNHSGTPPAFNHPVLLV